MEKTDGKENSTGHGRHADEPSDTPPNKRSPQFTQGLTESGEPTISPDTHGRTGLRAFLFERRAPDIVPLRKNVAACEEASRRGLPFPTRTRHNFEAAVKVPKLPVWYVHERAEDRWYKVPLQIAEAGEQATVPPSCISFFTLFIQLELGDDFAEAAS